mgnify:CR=1 FL=1
MSPAVPKFFALKCAKFVPKKSDRGTWHTENRKVDRACQCGALVVLCSHTGVLPCRTLPQLNRPHQSRFMLWDGQHRTVQISFHFPYRINSI